MSDYLDPYADSAWPSVEADTLEQADTPDEQMGTKEKFWVKREDDDRLWLFKFAREKNGEVRGEDWAEVIVHRIACLLGIPTAVAVPATYSGRRGILSRSVRRAENEILVHGNEMLGATNPSYDRDRQRENPDYSVGAVHSLLESIARVRPNSFGTSGRLDGFSAFASYLLLDAFVAGRDRHHKNWALIIDGHGDVRLSPSFDHGNALGFQEPEENVLRLLDDADGVKRWTRRGKSPHFAGRPALTELANEALGLADDSTRSTLIAKLAGVNFDDVREVVFGVPTAIMSEAKANFVLEVLSENRRRLLDGD
jgi:hypothetical protein